MGMFDNLSLDIPLPPGSPKSDFQTKDMECLLLEYRLDDGGQLWRCQPEWDWDDDTGERIELEKSWKKSFYTGKIYFYTSVRPHPEGRLEHWEYEAMFIKGELIALEQLKPYQDVIYGVFQQRKQQRLQDSLKTLGIELDDEQAKWVLEKINT